LGSSKSFEQFSKKRTNTNIEVISDSQGKLLTETDEFYQRLYSKKTNDPEAANHFLSQLQE